MLNTTPSGCGHSQPLHLVVSVEVTTTSGRVVNPTCHTGSLNLFEKNRYVNSVKLIFECGFALYVFTDVFRRAMVDSVQEIRFPKVGERMLSFDDFRCSEHSGLGKWLVMLLVEIRNSEVTVT
jgi:hypothetical protein